VLSVSENENGAMIELSGVSSESDSCDDENDAKATVSTTLKKPRSSSSSSYSRVGTVAAVASINRSYNNDMNKKALQLQRVARKRLTN